MTVVIKVEDEGQTMKKVVLYIIVIVVIVIIVYLLWRYLISPLLKGTLFPPAKVNCATAPLTPSGLTAATAPNNRAIVTWTATTNTDNYILYMGRAAGFSTSAAERTITVIGNSVAVLNLLPVTYYFKVAASNSCGTSSVSNEASATISGFPASFKLCKVADPTLCMIFQGSGQQAGITNTCSTGPCEFSYINNTAIKALNDNLCLFENPLGLTTVEEPVSSNPCNTPTIWNIDLVTGRVITSDNLCLGADNVQGGIAFNTNCSVISNPDDDRYSWTVQPTTN